MRAITLTQPWASLVAKGAKKIETRGWSTPYRGELAVHASKGWTARERALVGMEPFKSALEGVTVETMSMGVVLAVANLTAVRLMTDRDQKHELLGTVDIRTIGEPEKAFGAWEPGRFAFYLENVRVLPMPVKARGSLGIFNLDRLAGEEVAAQLEDFEERAGILEHEAGLTRAEAERLAHLFMAGPGVKA